MSFVELLIAAAIGSVVLLGLFSVYRASAVAFNQSSSQAALQRQGTLAMEAISRKLRRASSVGAVCEPAAPANTTGPMLHATVPDTSPETLADDGRYCYYAGNGSNGAPLGALCERLTPGPSGGTPGPCVDLLAGPVSRLSRGQGLSPMQLWTQPATPDERCPRPTNAAPPAAHPILPSQSCLALTAYNIGTAPSFMWADVAFAMTDGEHVITFVAGSKPRNFRP